MALPNLRTATNYPTATPFNSGSPSYAIFAEDWNQIKKTIEQGLYGMYTASMQIATASLGSDVLAVTGSSTFIGDLVLSGASSDLVVGGNATVTGLTTLSATTVSTTLTVGTGLTISAGGLTVTAGGIAITSGNISLAALATVDGVDISAHTHTGSGSNGPMLDGSTAITDATITYAKIAAASLGLTSNTLAKGVDLGNTRSFLGKLSDGVINLSPFSFWNFDSATNAVQFSLVAANNALEISPVNTGGPIGVRFDGDAVNGDTGLDSCWAMTTLPDGIDTGSAITISFYFTLPVAIAATKFIKMKLFAYPLTPGAGGDATNLDLRSSGSVTTSSVEYDSTATTNRVLVATMNVSSFSASDILYIGVQRIDATTGAGNNATAQFIHMMGAKVKFANLYA